MDERLINEKGRSTLSTHPIKQTNGPFTMPNKTFATLREEGDFTCLSVAPGIINKHFSAKQLTTIAEMVGDTGAIKYSASHCLLITVEAQRVEKIIEAFEAVDLYVLPKGNVALFKWCDFCDGQELPALELAQELYDAVEGFETKQRVRIGFNACASACYNAVYDDIGLVYHSGSVDIWVGAIPMGRQAKPGVLVAKKVPEQRLTSLLLALLQLYNEQAKDHEAFSKFAKRHDFLQQWFDEQLAVQYLDQEASKF